MIAVRQLRQGKTRSDDAYDDAEPHDQRGNGIVGSRNKRSV